MNWEAIGAVGEVGGDHIHRRPAAQGAMMTQSIETQIREHYSTIYMTIVSVVVALVFENLFAFMNGQNDLWSFSRMLLWVQAGIVVFNGVVYWYHSSLVASSLRQIFRLRDAANPFVVLFVLNALVATMARSDFALFFLVLGVQAFTGVQAFALWERRYEEQRGEPLVRGSFRAARRIVGVLGLAMILIGVGGWMGAVSLTGAVVGGLAFFPVAIWLQLEWQRGWQKATGISL